MSEMLEKILSDENIRRAKKRVYANKGAGGVDGVTVQELDEYVLYHLYKLAYRRTVLARLRKSYIEVAEKCCGSIPNSV